jgi:hypothetical protein
MYQSDIHFNDFTFESTFISELRVNVICYGEFKLFILTIVIYRTKTHAVRSTTQIYQSKVSTSIIKINHHD